MAVVRAVAVGDAHCFPNEAIVFALMLTAEFQQLVQALVERAFVVGLVAEKERQADFGAVSRVFVVEAALLEGAGADAEPLVLGQGIDQQVLGGSGGFVLGAEIGEELVVVCLHFPAEHDEVIAGKAVLTTILAGGGFAFGGAWAGGALRVGSVSSELCGRSCGLHFA